MTQTPTAPRPRLIHQLFELLQGINYEEFEQRSGLTRQTIKNWQRHQPLLLNYEACVNALGYDLVLQRREK